jgi:hypothetical protein
LRVDRKFFGGADVVPLAQTSDRLDHLLQAGPCKRFLGPPPIGRTAPPRYCRRGALMTHKYRGCIVVLSINKSVEPNEEQKVLTSSFDQGFSVNTSKRVFWGIW